MMESLVATEGFAIFVTGLLGVLLAAVWMLRNWAAGIMWSVSIVVFVFVGLFGLDEALFWLTIVATCILLMAGMIVRWSL